MPDPSICPCGLTQSELDSNLQRRRVNSDVNVLARCHRRRIWCPSRVAVWGQIIEGGESKTALSETRAPLRTKSSARSDMDAENSGDARKAQDRGGTQYRHCTCSRPAAEFDALEWGTVEQLGEAVAACPASGWCTLRQWARAAEYQRQFEDGAANT